MNTNKPTNQKMTAIAMCRTYRAFTWMAFDTARRF